MGTDMKGLQQFIADLRSTSTKEEHDQRINAEIVNIQKQFSQDDRLSGYQKKKYITKLIYIYLMSSCDISAYNVTFGTRQCLELVSSNIYSEKYIGYLAVLLLFGSSSLQKDAEVDFISLITDSLKKDLASNNEEFNALALQCIATLGNATWSQILVDDVFHILRSPTTPPLLKKRSSLSLLKLLRADKSVLETHRNWIPRILALADDLDLGVVQSALSLIEFIATEIDHGQVQSLIPVLSRKLHLLVLEPDRVPREYFFGGIANPWLIVKIAKLLTILLPEAAEQKLDQNTLRVLRESVSRVIEFTTKKVNDSAIRNAHNAVLFSMIHLAGLLNPSKEALNTAIDSISSLLDSKELNTRYLALNSLVTLTIESSLNKRSQKHLLKVFSLLKEQDTSISKKSLDLIYACADAESINYIITELLTVLKTSDHALKQDIAVKVSVLCETYATTPSWYVKTMFELIDNAGSSLNESIWERVVQIIVNNESLQDYTCKEILKYITKPKFTESMVKIAAYILGEYGYLINDGVSVQKQFDVLANIYFFVSNNTKMMILSSFMKMLKFDIQNKQLKSNLIKILGIEVNLVNLELQQRSFEYLTLIQKLNTKEGIMFFNLVSQETPAFNSLENKLLLKLAQRNPVKRGYITGTDSLTESHGNGTDQISSDLRRLDLSTDPFSDYTTESISSKPTNVTLKPQLKPDGPLSPNWQMGFYRLFEFNQGVFFENSLIKVILRVQKINEQKETTTFALTFTNKSPQVITSFIISLSNYRTINPDIIVNMTELPASEILVNDKAHSSLTITLRHPFYKFEEIPNLRIQFNSGGAFNSIRLKLPVFLTKFFKPAKLTSEQFIQRWSQIDSLGDQGESSRAIKSQIEVDGVWLERLIEKMGLSLVGKSSTSEILASGILSTSSSGNFGVLLRARPEAINEVLFTIRATGPGISSLLMDSLVRFFSH